MATRSVMQAPRAALALMLAAALAGCGGGVGGGAPRSAAFYGGEVVVAGPRGYCVDPASVQRGAASGFALMAGCGHLKGAPSGQVPAAVITVSILPRDPGAQAPTAAQLSAPWAAVGVAQQVDGADIAMIQVQRGGDTLLPQGDPRHWRGAMRINGHLVGLAVYGEAGAQVSGAAGKALLTAAARAMRAASSAQGPDVAGGS